MEVSHFGVHQSDGGVMFLEQAEGGSNALGMVHLKSPFAVQAKRGVVCNHRIRLGVRPDESHIERFRRILEDDLAKAMLPLPREPGGRAFFLSHPHNLDLVLLSLERMSSPINHTAVPFWAVTDPQLRTMLGESNVQPLVLVGVKTSDSARLSRVGQLTLMSPRPLLAVTADQMPIPRGFRPITTRLHEQLTKLVSLPLEDLGAWALTQFMRGELPTQLHEVRHG